MNNMTEQQPLVSIVIPCYNHEQFVQETIQSVIDQDYENIELIIIDDGSKDKSVDVIQQMIPACKKRFVRFEFRFRPNKGLCATLNEALEWCEGEYFSPIASDDILFSEKTKIQVRVFRRESSDELVGVFSGIELINNNGLVIKKKNGRNKFFSFSDILLRKAFLPAPSAMLVLKKVKGIGGYNPDFSIEDFYMWLRLTEKGGGVYSVPDILVAYRRHEGNFSKRHEEMWRGIEEVINQYQAHPLYKKAVARSMLVHAHDLQASDKLLSLFWFFRVLKINAGTIFTRSFFVFLLKLVLPRGRN